MQISPSPSPVPPIISPADIHEIRGSFLLWALLILLFFVVLVVLTMTIRFEAQILAQAIQVRPRRRLIMRGPQSSQSPPNVLPSEMTITSIICTYRIEKPEKTAGAAESGGDCAICLEDFKYGDECRMFVSCNHGFHRACIDKWLDRYRHCALCRGSV